MKKFGPWIVWGKKERPEGLKGYQRMEAVFLNGHGDMIFGDERSVGAHSWDGAGLTLAYRLEVKDTKIVIFGSPENGWRSVRMRDDTHEITLVIGEHEEVVSCSARKL